MISNFQNVSTMSYLRFILIGTPVDKCQQQDTKADQQRHTAFAIKNY